MNINAVIQPAGFVLPVSLQLFDMLMVEAGEKTASKHRITAVTLNFRDPNYSAERGGYHPVEIRLVHQGDEWCLDYATDFGYVGTVYPELEKIIDISWSQGYVRRVSGDGCRLGRALARHEIRSMLAAAATFSTVRCQRERAILLLLCGAGLRAGELVALNAEDIDVAAGIVWVREGKGRKSREIHLAAKVCTQLRRWLKCRGDHEGPLFSRISRADRPGPHRLTTTGLTGLLAQLREAAGVDYFTPHDLRRTFITQLLEQGTDLNVVRQLAGHADIATTTRYDYRGRGTQDRASRAFCCW